MNDQQMADLREEIMDKLDRVFRLKTFRSNQYEAVLSTLLGYDVFVLMATGGGKSLCYQLAAVCQRGRVKGVTVVVTPLIALMNDQVSALEAKKIEVISLMADLSEEKSDEIKNRLRSRDKPSLLYLTPEKLDRSQGTRQMLKALNYTGDLARFVVDEAHCVSAWGRGFREAVKFVLLPCRGLGSLALHIVHCAFRPKTRLPECPDHGSHGYCDSAG